MANPFINVELKDVNDWQNASQCCCSPNYFGLFAEHQNVNILIETPQSGGFKTRYIGNSNGGYTNIVASGSFWLSINRGYGLNYLIGPTFETWNSAQPQVENTPISEADKASAIIAGTSYVSLGIQESWWSDSIVFALSLYPDVDPVTLFSSQTYPRDGMINYFFGRRRYCAWPYSSTYDLGIPDFSPYQLAPYPSSSSSFQPEFIRASVLLGKDLRNESGVYVADPFGGWVVLEKRGPMTPDPGTHSTPWLSGQASWADASEFSVSTTCVKIDLVENSPFGSKPQAYYYNGTMIP